MQWKRYYIGKDKKKVHLIHLVNIQISKDWIYGVHKIFSKDLGFGINLGLFFIMRENIFRSLPKLILQIGWT